jgi:glycolate oxidase
MSESPFTPLSSAVFGKIRRVVGDANCSRDLEERLCYAFDATRYEYLPEAVVFPGNAGEIASILRFANHYRFPVIPRGAGSGMSGGSVAVAGGVVLVLTRLNRIIDIDTRNFVATVEPGVVTEVFQQAVAEKGLFYPPDPSSAGISTLGGNVAECAGGPKAVKYGVTRDYVLGLEAVLPTGEVVRTGVRTAKGVVGYDVSRLMTGSEGTLGIITRLTLRLLPRPKAVKTLTAFYDRMETAAESVSAIIAGGVIPRTVEYMDKASIDLVEDYLGLGLDPAVEALLIIEVDGSPAEVSESASTIRSLCISHGAREVAIAKDEQAAQKLWKARKSISPALYKLAPDKINEDIVVPRSRIPDMVGKIRELGRRTGLTMVSFGHAGDGNIHFNIMLDKKNPQAVRAATAVLDEVFEYTLALGGTISGEHGVGIAKSAYMAKEIEPEMIDLMRRIKKAFDPAGILNPGKMGL